MDQIYTPTEARKNIFKILKGVNKNNKPVVIKPQKNNEKGAVIIGEDDWNAIQETLFLVNNGVDKQIKEREQDDSGFTDVDDIDWDKL
ncbi:type II toxin-antitoxin system Phd/YefM family antitoxin [Limosilactobacillus sp.]|uniref:type II toxin-antitoxin system Phd/YefM family antitoxin n=1 Tax=Limosilactobacillus sp. TaxID=2773925 RepID=UPI00345EB29E